MRRILGCFLQIVGLLTTIGIVAGMGMLAVAGYWMDINEKPFKADYILPLAGDQNRMLKAMELYKEGYAPTILVSNAVIIPPTPYEKLEWEIGYPNLTDKERLQRMLTALNANSAKLEPFGNGHVSTVEEIEALKTHLKGKNVRILVITSPYHARRAKMILEDILPDCETRVTTTGKVGSFKKAWWKDQLSAIYLVPEFAKTIHYMMGGVFRSTDSPSN